MPAINSILVLAVDRDNDLGRKTPIQGPVIGSKAVLNAAAKLAVADPEESDANCMFAAVKKLEEVKKEFASAEVAVLTGIDKSGFPSDKRVSEQLDMVLEKFPADACVLVTDGAEDDQVIPILQSRLRIISKQTVIIKQAQQVESTFYTIREAFKDPFIARLVFGIPGIILLLFFLIGSVSLQIVSLVVGVYLILKGFGIEEFLASGFYDLRKSISIQRTSFPLYLASFFILIFAIITLYNAYANNLNTGTSIDIVTVAVQSIQSTFLLLFLTAEAFILAKILDAIHLKKAFLLTKYFLYAVSFFLFWIILDAGTDVFLKQADLNWFLANILVSFVILLLAFRAVGSLDIRKKITKMLVGLPVYNRDGRWLGKIQNVFKEKELIEYFDNKTKKTLQADKTQFTFSEGRITLNE